MPYSQCGDSYAGGRGLAWLSYENIPFVAVNCAAIPRDLVENSAGELYAGGGVRPETAGGIIPSGSDAV